MINKKINTIKLGAFITAGLLFLIVMLYMIGRDQNLFNANITLRARFSNANGLVPGNNVRYAGIQVGTVKKVKLINDTVIEVVMLIDQKYKPNIHRNSLAAIRTEGFIGNKIVNIMPGNGNAAEVEDGDIIWTKKSVDTDEMLETLSVSNKNVALISENLKLTVERINNSRALWNLLSDEQLPKELKASVLNIRQGTVKANRFISDLQEVMADVKQGKGSLGAILKDTALSIQLNTALEQIRQVGEEAHQLGSELNQFTKEVSGNVSGGKGPAHAFLKDSAMVERINKSLSNIQDGTAAFNDNMEALKHSFLFRGYFKRQERRKSQATDKKD